MSIAWFDSAFADFIAEVEELREEELDDGHKELMKLAYVAGAKEATEFCRIAVVDELG